MYDEPSMAETKLAGHLKNPLLWPVPALVTSGLILLGSGRVWTDKLPSRRGAPISVAEGSIKLTLAGLALYGLALVLEKTGVIFRDAMNPVAAMQEGFTAVIFKLLLLAIPYLCAANLVLRYVLS